GGAGTGGVGAYDQSTLGTSPFASRSANTDPALAQQQSGHHYGRDAALAGGAAGIGAGAYEHGRHQGGSSDAALGTSTFDPRSTNTGNVVDPSTDPTFAQQQQGHHYGRDAALVGGAGAAGAGAYEYGKHHGTGNNLGTSTVDPISTDRAPVVDPNHDPVLAREREERQRFARDAAVTGGAGAAGYGAYEALDPKEQEKARKAQQHQMDKDMKHSQHQTEKDLKHQQKEREHEIAKQEKMAEKQREKEADRSEKEAERATRDNEQPEKKHHGILGFLHRDKKNEPEEDLRQ
ncbi:hypothetical protein KCU67_g16025, partial [Aureobasidium melanogenum]